MEEDVLKRLKVLSKAPIDFTCWEELTDQQREILCLFKAKGPALVAAYTALQQVREITNGDTKT